MQFGQNPDIRFVVKPLGWVFGSSEEFCLETIKAINDPFGLFMLVPYFTINPEVWHLGITVGKTRTLDPFGPGITSEDGIPWDRNRYDLLLGLDRWCFPICFILLSCGRRCFVAFCRHYEWATDQRDAGIS